MGCSWTNSNLYNNLSVSPIQSYCIIFEFIIMMDCSHSSGSDSGLESPLKEGRQGKQGSRIPTKAMTTMDTTKLEKLILDHQKLNKKITGLIQTGVNLIQNDKYREAIGYFQEAENILQYAASCGKSLDRILIIATLENKACIYQRLWEQQKSYNYIEAILYNINNSQGDSLNQLCKQEQKNMANMLNRKQSLALYHLKFSAVASQIKNHEIALSSAFKSIKNIKQICKTSYDYMLKSKLSSENQRSFAIIKQISECQEKIETNNSEEYMKKTKAALLEVKKSKNSKLTKEILEEIQSFTIGEVMQIFPVTIDQLTTVPSLQQQLSYIGSIFRALYFSISYFAVATQLRLLTPSKISVPKHTISEQFIKSQLYHLNAIYIAAKLVPCPTKYLNHIIKSYSNHYESEIKDYYDENKVDEFEEKISEKEQKDDRAYRKHTMADSKEKRRQTYHKNSEKQDDLPNGSEMKGNAVFKQKKSKGRNSSAELTNGRSKKSLNKQKSTVIIKNSHKPQKKNEQFINAYCQEQIQKPLHKKTKIQSMKVLKAPKSIHNKSSKSKSKSPSVNLQKKMKSPSKKQKKNIKFQQQYYLQSNTDRKKEKEKEIKKKKQTYSKIVQCRQRPNNEYTTDYLKSSSKLEELGRSLKSGIQKETRKQYVNY